MNLTKEKIFGFSGSLIFCLILMLILLFSVLRTVISQQEEGILVNFGNIDAAAGIFEPMNSGQSTRDQIETAAPSIPPVSNPTTETAMTQNVEETVHMPDAKDKEEDRRRQQEEQRRATEQRQAAEAEQRQRAEQQRQQQAINNQVAGAFGAGNTGSSSQGTASSGSGNQGSPQGNSDQGANSGTGGYGEFSLAGRSIGSGGLPRPTYTVQEEGRIVVDITVDTKGNVILATIGKGTNIDNDSMRRSALDAAKKAKFNSISGNTNQSGTITYKYYLR